MLGSDDGWSKISMLSHIDYFIKDICNSHANFTKFIFQVEHYVGTLFCINVLDFLLTPTKLLIILRALVQK